MSACGTLTEAVTPGQTKTTAVVSSRSYIAFLLRFHLISKAGPVFLSYVAYLIPIFAIFWGYVFLGEIVKIEQTIAIVFIFIGIYVGQKGSNVKNDLQ